MIGDAVVRRHHVGAVVDLRLVVGAAAIVMVVMVLISLIAARAIEFRNS
jgi:hypothetical protein